MLHGVFAPFGVKPLGIGEDAIEVMDRRHMVRVILVISLRTFYPPETETCSCANAAEIGVLPAISENLQDCFLFLNCTFFLDHLVGQEVQFPFD